MQGEAGPEGMGVHRAVADVSCALALPREGA